MVRLLLGPGKVSFSHTGEDPIPHVLHISLTSSSCDV